MHQNKGKEEEKLKLEKILICNNEEMERNERMNYEYILTIILK